MKCKTLYFLFFTAVCPILAHAQAVHGTEKFDSIPSLNEDAFPDADTDKFTRLTDLDYQRVANQLGIEIAAIKAVSDIEAGKSHRGFVEPGHPVINFSKSLFRQRLRKAGKNPAKYSRSHSAAFAALNVKKYGSYGKAQHARLDAAAAIDSAAAYESTYWGMFQIGGFNWRKCGVDSPEELARQMAESEAMQLELFARFIENNGMVKYLKRKDWRGFAKAYNGARAIKRGYHRRMAAAYAKYKKQ